MPIPVPIPVLMPIPVPIPVLVLMPIPVLVLMPIPVLVLMPIAIPIPIPMPMPMPISIRKDAGRIPALPARGSDSGADPPRGFVAAAMFTDPVFEGEVFLSPEGREKRKPTSALEQTSSSRRSPRPDEFSLALSLVLFCGSP